MESLHLQHHLKTAATCLLEGRGPRRLSISLTPTRTSKRLAITNPAFPHDIDAAPRWVRHLDKELTGAAIPEFHDDEEDRCELPLCAPCVLTGGGYNRLYSEGGVRMHVRACLHA